MSDGYGATVMIDDNNVTKEKINSIQDKLSEIKDLQLVNKLDIMNLKNEIEKLQFNILSLPPETVKKIQDLVKLSGETKEFEKLKSISNEFDNIKKRLQKVESLKLDEFKTRISAIDQRLDEKYKRIDELVTSLGDLPKVTKMLSEQGKYEKILNEIRSRLDLNNQRLSKLESKKDISEELSYQKSQIMAQIQELSSKLITLSEEVKTPKSLDEIKNRINQIDQRMSKLESNEMKTEERLKKIFKALS